MNSGDRIRQLRLQNNMTLEELGARVGVGKSTVRKWETGAIANMRRDKIAKLAEALSTTVTDIMGLEAADAPSSPPPGFQSMPAMDNVTPLIGDIACGTPILAEENIRDLIPTPYSWHADFALECRGDSMAPKIQDGDIVAIRKVELVENGQIAAVRIDDEAMLKRCYLYPDKLVLQAENPAYEPIVLIGPEMVRASIEGLAVGFMRNI